MKIAPVLNKTTSGTDIFRRALLLGGAVDVERRSCLPFIPIRWKENSILRKIKVTRTRHDRDSTNAAGSKEHDTRSRS